MSREIKHNVETTVRLVFECENCGEEISMKIGQKHTYCCNAQYRTWEDERGTHVKRIRRIRWPFKIIT